MKTPAGKAPQPALISAGAALHALLPSTGAAGMRAPHGE